MGNLRLIAAVPLFLMMLPLWALAFVVAGGISYDSDCASKRQERKMPW